MHRDRQLSAEKVVVIRDPNIELLRDKTQDIPKPLQPTFRSHVLFTSGTTGTPKGVQIPAAGIVRIARDPLCKAVSGEDTVGHLNNPCFDVSLIDMWCSLINGTTIVVMDRRELLSPELFARSLKKQQYAKLSGYKVITTCSPRNNDLVKALGADAVFDYNDPECAAKIRAYTNDSLAVALDTISLADSAKICEGALASSPRPGTTLRYHALLPATTARSDVTDSRSLAYTAMGEAWRFNGEPQPVIREDFEYAVKFWDLSRELLASGKLKVPPVQLGQGLDGVLDGLQALRGNKVSGKKLVYKV